MDEDPAVTSSKTKSHTRRKIKSGLQNFSAKIETLENKYEEIRRRIRKKSRSDSPKKSSSEEPTEAAEESDTKEAASPPCRSVMLFMHALSLDPIVKEVNLANGDNRKPEYVKLNPQRTIPVIVDDGFVLSESRAILGYLAERYGGENASYYPNDPKARGVINQRLLFDACTLYQRFLDAYLWIIYSEVPVELNEQKVQKLREAFEFLEIFMGDSMWMAGDEITIADYSLVVTVSTVEACGFDVTRYRKVSRWLERCKRQMVNYEEANQKGADIFGRLVREKLKTPES